MQLVRFFQYIPGSIDHLTEGGYVGRQPIFASGTEVGSSVTSSRRKKMRGRGGGRWVVMGSETQEARAGGGTCHSTGHGVGASILKVLAGNDVELLEPTVIFVMSLVVKGPRKRMGRPPLPQQT